MKLKDLSQKQRKSLRHQSGLDSLLASMMLHPEMELTNQAYLNLNYPGIYLTPETVFKHNPEFTFPPEFDDEELLDERLKRLGAPDERSIVSHDDLVEQSMKAYGHSREEAEEALKAFGG